MVKAIPHPFPYQGSKRSIVNHILSKFPVRVGRLIEPFCGAGAVSIAAAARGVTRSFYLNDANESLMALWREILERPTELADAYETLWHQQQADKKAFFAATRDEFNRFHRPHHLLYLLARIVKGSVRYSGAGHFNQSADNRRAGMRPQIMRRNICGVSALLAGKTKITAGDFRAVLSVCNKHDLIYMDPPYQGTSFCRDHRYFSGLSFDDFVAALDSLTKRDLSFIVSYDGETGDKKHGKTLPLSLGMAHFRIPAGRSTQATLLGMRVDTVESLYLSAPLVEQLHQWVDKKPPQQKLIFA